MTDLLTPGHPAAVADLFEAGIITWETGWGDREMHTCAHGALIRPCSTAGDEIMWSVLMSYRGLTMGWNDEQESSAPVIARLRELGNDPTEAEMVEVFSPAWRQVRHILRTAASDVQPARDARAARAAWAARVARAAWVARAPWAPWAARDARDARAAWAAVHCLARGWIDQDTYDAAVAPWVSVFGPLEETP